MNALDKKRQELVDYRECLPEYEETYWKLNTEMNEFDKRVREFLTENFNASQTRSLVAILRSIPSGNLDYIFDAWIAELKNLGIEVKNA